MDRRSLGVFVLSLALAPATAHAQGNLVLNGDFELTTATPCDYNIANPNVVTKLPHVVGYGAANEIDIMRIPACYGGGAASGAVRVGITCKFPEPPVDEFALELSGPLSGGAIYDLSFAIKAQIESFSLVVGGVDVGLSTSPTSFGTLVHSTSAIGSTWTTVSTSLVATAGATWLTVRHWAGIDSTWTHVDAFVLQSSQCLAQATATPFGSGKAGTPGVPVLASGLPKLGDSVTVTLSNALPGAKPFIVIGLQAAALPFDGGTLYVWPPNFVALPPVPPSGTLSITSLLPYDGNLCGSTFYLQALHVDPGAAGPFHTAQSNALAWYVGD